MGNMGEVRTSTAYPARAAREANPRQAMGRVGGEEKVATPAETVRKAEAAVVKFTGSGRDGLIAINEDGKVIAERPPIIMDGPVYTPEIAPAPVSTGQPEQVAAKEVQNEGPITKEFGPDPAKVVPDALAPTRVVSEFGGRAKEIEGLMQ